MYVHSYFLPLVLKNNILKTAELHSVKDTSNLYIHVNKKERSEGGAAKAAGEEDGVGMWVVVVVKEGREGGAVEEEQRRSHCSPSGDLSLSSPPPPPPSTLSSSSAETGNAGSSSLFAIENRVVPLPIRSDLAKRTNVFICDSEVGLKL